MSCTHTKLYYLVGKNNLLLLGKPPEVYSLQILLTFKTNVLLPVSLTTSITTSRELQITREVFENYYIALQMKQSNE